MLDFTIKALTELYQSLLRNNYKIINVSGFLERKSGDRVCILRHDADRGIKSAERLAVLERKFNISASYYFRYPQTFNKTIIRNIYNLGHEIGYHYEVLAKAKGDYKHAISIFRKELEEFRKIVAIKTISAHGSPLSKWDNRKLWEQYNFNDFEIIGETYLSLDFNEVFYLTDTGRAWNKNKGNIRDKVTTKFNYSFHNTFEFIRSISNNELPDKIMLNIHPHRWSNNLIKWTGELIGQKIKNLGKELLFQHR